MAQKYRMSFGVDLAQERPWGELASQDRFFCFGDFATREEAATMHRAGATLVLYSEAPDEFLQRMFEMGFTISDFRWINVSKE